MLNLDPKNPITQELNRSLPVKESIFAHIPKLGNKKTSEVFNRHLSQISHKPQSNIFKLKSAFTPKEKIEARKIIKKQQIESLPNDSMQIEDPIKELKDEFKFLSLDREDMDLYTSPKKPSSEKKADIVFEEDIEYFFYFKDSSPKKEKSTKEADSNKNPNLRKPDIENLKPNRINTHTTPPKLSLEEPFPSEALNV